MSFAWLSDSSLSGMGRVRAALCNRSDVSSPSAEKFPAQGGMMSSRISSSRANSVASIGPAPPNGSNFISLGSKPCSTVISRMALAMAATAMVIIPSAVCVRS